MIWSKFSHFIEYALELTLFVTGVAVIVHSMWRTTTKEFVRQALQGGALVALAFAFFWSRGS